MARDRAIAGAEYLDTGSASYYLGANADVSRALGLRVERTDLVDRGTFLMVRGAAGHGERIVVGTRQADPYEAVRREARRTVRELMFAVTPYELRYRHARQLAAEQHLDDLIGSPPAWPT